MRGPALAGPSLVPHTGLGNGLAHQNDVKVVKRGKGLPKGHRGRNRAMTIVKIWYAALVAALTCVIAVPAAAQDKVWRHGLINAKADAGIFMMVSTHDFAAKQGLKLEISQFKDDQIALKALIAGELDSFE